MLKKFLSTFIAVFTLITVVATSVYADFSITDFYPYDDNIYYSIKYDNSLDNNVTVNDVVVTGDTVLPDEFDVYENTKDGANEFVVDTGSKNTVSKSIKIYPQLEADSTTYDATTKIDSGKYLVISFDITRYSPRSDKGRLRIAYSNHNGTELRSSPYILWTGENLQLRDKNNNHVTIYSDMTVQSSSDIPVYHNIAFVINSDYNAALYIDGVLVKDDIVKQETASYFSAFQLFFEANAYFHDSQVVKLKNFQMYTAEQNGIVKDIDYLAASNLTAETPDDSGNYVLTQDLTLPTTGVGGSTITWYSSNEDIISSDGTIHRHSGYEKSEAVTLTAKVVNGEVEASKNFTFYVKRKDFAIAADMDGDYIVYDDFSNSNLGYKVSSNQKGSISGEAFVMQSVANKEGDTQFYFAPDQSYFNTGRYIVEYDFKWSGEGRLRWEIRSDISRGYRHIRLQKDSGSLKIYNEQNHSTDSAAKNISDIDILTKDESHHFKYLIDASNSTYSLYVDGALLVKDAYRSVPASGTGYATGCGSLVKQSYTSGSMTLELDNLAVYKLKDDAVFAPEASAKTISLNGENVSQIEATGTYAAKLNITDYTTEYTDDTDFVVALYNKNTNELASVELVKAEVLKATLASDGSTESYGLYAKATVEVPKDYENYYIKLMHWNGNVPVSSSVKVD